MRHIKYFEEKDIYDSYINSSDAILPNVSYIEETKDVKYGCKKPEKTYTLRATYNATPDNLVAFTDATNVKSLKVNGTSIKFEPIKNEITTFDVLGENISLDLETNAATFPESYLIKSPVSSWSFKAKDPNYTINENTYACILGMENGMTMAQPIPLEAMDYAFTTNDGITLEVIDTFLNAMNAQIQSGVLQIGFTLINMDLDNETFTFIDTEHQTGVTTGGLPTYSFDSEGSYDVEIGLVDSLIEMLFTGTPLISIEIGDSITSIGEHAFENCSGLTSINIPDSVTSIGYAAFSGCSGLTSINIPNSIKTIDRNAFHDCTGLTGVYISDIAAWCNITFGGQSQVSSNPLYNDGCNLYLNNELVMDLIIPDGVTTINDYAFTKCYSLTSVNIPDSVTSIGDWAFANCSGLTKVTIGTGVTEIGINTFYYCRDLNSITCYAPIAPTIDLTTFQAVRNLIYGVSGTLYVPVGSDYSSWMSNDAYYLGHHDWEIQYI